ncbi:MAG: ABC transporter permease [Clostridia bacterium]|nr:ABC transporter permease [Clostridia bacterium]
MTAIFKREFKSYFATPIGYTVLAAFYFFLSVFFVQIYSAGVPQISWVIMSMSTVAIFVLPVLTMRIISEDRKQKVDQALFTAPVSLTSVVLGKFLAAFAVYAIGFLPTVIFEAILMFNVTVNFMSYIYSLLGILLLGACLISIGMFISSLTESSVISAIITLLINIVILFDFAKLITVPTAENAIGKVWAKLVEWFVWLLEKLSFMTVFQNFGENVFSIADIVYFLSITAVFIFLCVRSLERKRWA